MKTITIPLVLLLLVAGIGAQTIQVPLIPPNALNVNVVLFGHSWVVLMEGFQPWAFPNIPSNHVSIQGFDGYNCSMLLQVVGQAVPASTNAVFIMAATNDVLQGIPANQHIACMESMIDFLIGENPNMLILVSNVPPIGMNIGDFRYLIQQYNQAYLTLPTMYPNNVKLVDMWTPMVDTNGWALMNMFKDGVHFGPNGKDLVMGTIRDSLYSNLPQ